MTRVYLSVDLEGVAGISHDRPTTRGDDGYDAAVALMVGEANAAIEGAFTGGAAEVVLNDSHGSMYNLVPADLDPRAVVVQGQKAWSMVQGAEPGSALVGDGPFGVALFVGYHARAGHPTGVIAHTYSSAPTLTTLDGRPVGETGINAAVLGAWGIPVGLVAGDDRLADEVADWLPNAERVVVKRAVGWRAAASVHPSVARDLVRAGAERAVRRAAAGELEPLTVPTPVRIEVEYRNGGEADHAAVVPLTERYGDRGVRISAPDMPTAYRAFLAGIRLVSFAAA
ncbi:MAG TPA: M55 family metallopeptidase [Vitreimonas sp.]|nr:M55 family metallopeptidase [Vitreimonas sp.]